MPAEAERLLRRAIEVTPAFVPAYVELASLLCGAGRADEALAMFDGVLAVQPRSLWALSLKAAVLESERRSEEALATHEALVSRAPGAAVPWLNYGHALSACGRPDEAVAAYRRSLECDPDNGFAWWGLANLRTVRLSAKDVALMEGALPRAADDLHRILLHFALGKALGDVNSFEASFGHYEQANRIRGQVLPYDAKATADRVSQAATTFTPELLAQRSGLGCNAPDPIFIVGMPRSGSTLVEQILDSHPLIEGTGELPALGEIAARLGAMGERSAARLEPGELKALGESYIAATRRHRRTERPLFTDKMPANWQHIGLIKLALPRAKIIDVRRDPLACCFSAFTTYFNRQTCVPTSLQDWGRYYRAYADMVGILDAAAPGSIHRVSYESLVHDLEGEVRRLLDYLGLPFDEACLRFHENPRAVYTPSAQQVRQSINRSGLDRWRSYERWLDPLKRELDGRERWGKSPQLTGQQYLPR